MTRAIRGARPFGPSSTSFRCSKSAICRFCRTLGFDQVSNSRNKKPTARVGFLFLMAGRLGFVCTNLQSI